MIVVDMTQTHCGVCHIRFAMPTSLFAQCKEQGHKKPFWCPAGHELIFRDSELDQVRRERDRLKQMNAQLHEEARIAVRARTAAEAEVKRHQRRAKAGLCPCCNRSFVNMQRHMKTKHPDFATLQLVKETA